MVWQVAGIEVTQKRQVRSNAAGGGRFLLPRRFRNERGEKTSDTIWVRLGAHPLILPFMDSTYDISNLYIYMYWRTLNVLWCICQHNLNMSYDHWGHIMPRRIRISGHQELRHLHWIGPCDWNRGKQARPWLPTNDGRTQPTKHKDTI